MYQFFIDTHDEIVRIALFETNKIIAKKEKKSTQNHSVITMPLIEELFKENSITNKDIKEILVINGPGSFTGVRIGVTIAKTMAFLLNIPIKTMTSLDAIACSIKSDKNKLVTVTDRNGYYIGYYDNNNTLLEPATYVKNDDIVDYLTSYPEQLIENIDYNYENISKFSNDVKSIPVHNANPVYIKIIEVQNG